ncbi:hypothetical protein K505DRAFT_421799 [Melanomma pulvis-pyrius CBS 109.77]|uniref:Fork-head domain-containing protein n=1 Tax=Melanomma pulvis-pyrius CBS 109.77 TaxID=1314802 RepID=A0A6A6WTL0_9PLEO|nr:hypothetical protein K505DRAFT_421799 [Melanomma pulvis-pyrius CBS 109.77]
MTDRWPGVSCTRASCYVQLQAAAVEPYKPAHNVKPLATDVGRHCHPSCSSRRPWGFPGAPAQPCPFTPSRKVIFRFDCRVLTTRIVSRASLAVFIARHRRRRYVRYLDSTSSSTADSSTAMPQPQSPHRPSSTDVADGFGNMLTPKDTFCTPVPLPSPGPISSPSPRPSVISTTMTTAFPASATSKEPHLPPSLMDLDDANSFHWVAHCDLPMSRLGQEDTGYDVPSQYMTEPVGNFNSALNGLPYNANFNITYPPHDLGASCPRSYTSMGMSDSYPPSAYQIEPQRPQDVMDLADQGISGQLMQLSDEYEHQYATTIKTEDHGDYSSPYGSNTTRSSTPNDDPPMPPQDLKNECCGEENPIDKEQPYAQLIYRALLEKPGHTMILREIYNWFMENTDKAADKETKGWQNSIRHNLSMNGAFEKVDQPCEDSKKGFMWRLTEKAIREGVKSTTRYRSKQPNKRGNRSHNPLPQRQASGAKGGQAARRSAKMRRTNRMNEGYRSEPYMSMSRSVPTSYNQHFGPSSADIPMSYPRSPFYSSETDNGYASMQDDFGSPLGPPGIDLLPERSYSASPLSQGACHDSAYVLFQDPSEPMFSNSPSPPVDEPLTPLSPGVDWGLASSGLSGGPFIFGDHTAPYRELI